MAIICAAHHSRTCREQADWRSHRAGPRSLAAKFLTVGVVLCSLSFAGCARNPPPRELAPAVHESKAPPQRTPARPRRIVETIRYVQPTIRRPDPALLAPQPAPNCEFKRSDLKTIDPDGWARLKIEYERQCFEDAEKTARERLVLLQTSGSCEVEPEPGRKPAPGRPTQPNK
jgi:hypothetical protein